MRETDLIYRRIKEIVWSAEGQKAAIGAVESELSPLCGVDPLLQAQLGSEYKSSDGPMNAGYVVAALMRKLGYEEIMIGGKFKTGICPDGCVSRTGRLWRAAKNSN